MPPDSSTKSLAILLVEDHADTAKVLADFLAGMGHTVKVADSVETAVRSVIDNHFDVIISDVGLPDGNGVSLIHGLRPFCETPAIAHTAYSLPEDVERCLRAGFDLHLAKPASPKALQKAIETVLRR